MLIKTNDITVDEIRTLYIFNVYCLNNSSFLRKKCNDWWSRYGEYVGCALSIDLPQKERNKAYRELKQLVSEAKEYMSNEVV